MGIDLDHGWIRASVKYMVPKAYKVETEARKSKLGVTVYVPNDDGFELFTVNLPLFPTNSDILDAADVLSRRIEDTIG